MFVLLQAEGTGVHMMDGLSKNWVRGEPGSANNTEAELCEYLLSVRRYPAWREGHRKRNLGDSAAFEPTRHAPTFVGSAISVMSTSVGRERCHVQACGTRCQGPPACAGMSWAGKWCLPEFKDKFFAATVSQHLQEKKCLTENVIIYNNVWVTAFGI